MYPWKLRSYRVQFWLLTVAAVLLLIAPVRLGDLAGYDDAVYAHIARAIVNSGNWIDIQSNGYPALEHPPGFVWMQAVLFSLFGFSDFLAKLPSAAAGVGTVVLVFWLARRQLRDEQSALIAMFVMLATPYFIKYTSHGMTDVPFTFLFTAAVCAWVAAETKPVWLLGVFAATAYALLTRGVVGVVVPVALGVDWFVRRRQSALALLPLVLSFVPVLAWYSHLIGLYGDFFWTVQTNFLNDKVNGDVAGSYRRFTGVFEYAWMMLQSYWPWLPLFGYGLWLAIREKRLKLLVIWSAVMYAACSVGGSRVLRYLLPAYPAFSILTAFAIARLVKTEVREKVFAWVAPVALVAAVGVALFPPVSMHAEEVRPIAEAATKVTAATERIGFYDQGQSRFDETGQIQWYGDRTMWILTSADGFKVALAEPIAKVWIVDQVTFDQYFAARTGMQVVARSGHLVLVKIT